MLCKVMDEREEVVVDRERNVCDPILSVCSVLVSKEKLWKHNSQGNDILNVCSYSYIVFLLNKPYLSLNLSNGVRIVTCPPKELL